MNEIYAGNEAIAIMSAETHTYTPVIQCTGQRAYVYNSHYMANGEFERHHQHHQQHQQPWGMNVAMVLTTRCFGPLNRHRTDIHPIPSIYLGPAGCHCRAVHRLLCAPLVVWIRLQGLCYQGDPTTPYSLKTCEILLLHSPKMVNVCVSVYMCLYIYGYRISEHWAPGQ